MYMMTRLRTLQKSNSSTNLHNGYFSEHAPLSQTFETLYIAGHITYIPGFLMKRINPAI